MALKLPDSAVPMGDFPVAKAVDIDFNDGENLQEKLDNGKLGGGGSSPEKQIKDWVSGSSYLEGDYVYHEGEIYRCLTSNNDVDFDEANWEQLTYSSSKIYNDIIEGKLIDQTVIDKYGTDILKYPLGIWRISEDNISDKFSDLPVETSGRIEITSIDADTNKNPWNNSWSYRAYNFETYNGMNYFRKLSSGGTVGVRYDTDWQRVCSTIVADVGVTTITPVDSAITGTIEYTVKNGICYVSINALESTISSIGLSISTTMPKPSVNCSAVSINTTGIIARIYMDKNTAKINGNFYEKNAKSYCSFSYPVAE